jgi:transposase
MFIRKTYKTDRKTGKRYCSYQLMESFRTERGPRQRLLLNLGSELTLTAEDRKLLSNRIEELQTGVNGFLEYPDDIEKLAQTYHDIICKKHCNKTIKKDYKTYEKDFQSVDVNTIKHEYCRSVGLEYIVLETIKKLELDKLLANSNITPRMVKIILGVIVGKLCLPSSERATHKWLQTISGIDELLETDFSQLSQKLVYQATDNLLRNKDVIEQKLEQKEQDLFSLENTIILYDLTNTYFEGPAKNIETAHRGHSKEKRTDCPLVTLGLVLNEEGFPKRSCLLPGNISEPKTLEEALRGMSNGKEANPVVVIDGGIATKDNLNYLKENGYRYIVASRSRSVDIPEDLNLDVIREENDNKIKAGQIKDEKTKETLLYCHSESREKKEQSICQLKQKRLEKDLQKIADGLEKKGGQKSFKLIAERIGRLKERHSSIASHYDIKIETDQYQKKVEKVSWELNKQSLKKRYQGGYLLKAYGLDWSSEELWKTYIMLTRVEESFRCLKTDLNIRPVYHKTTKRVDGHLFLTVIAYHILQSILHQLRKKRINIKWTTLRRAMQNQVRVTTAVHLENGKHLRVRSTTYSESFHKEIYEALGLSSRPGKTIKTII